VSVDWSPRALSDRAAALRHIAKDSRRAAQQQGDRIIAQVDSLLAHPFLGRVGRMRGTRELIIAGTPFLAIYRISPRSQQVEILRVIHGAQQWPPKK
jgi:toxin ParE1/3/4